MSKQQFLARGAMPTSDLPFLFSGRRYGMYLTPEERFDQPLPEFLGSLAQELRAESKLLQLSYASTLTNDDVYDAYKADVHYFGRRLSDIERMIQAAVDASVRKEYESYRRIGLSVDQPKLKRNSFIGFTAELAAQPVDELLPKLHEEVENGIHRLLQSVCAWLDELVQKEYVGLVTFVAPTVGHYYYFHPEVHREVVSEDTVRDVSHDPTQPYGSRVTYMKHQKDTVRTVETLERHDHHIVRARTEPLQSYRERIPKRIVERMLEETSAWLIGKLTVVSGDITHEEIRNRTLTDTTVVHEKKTVWKDSPAITWGPYALVGWSSDTLRDEPSEKFKPKRLMKRDHGRIALKSLWFVVMWGAIIGLPFWGISSCVSHQNKQAILNHVQFERDFVQGRTILTLSQDDVLTFAGGQKLQYLGVRRGTASFARIDQDATRMTLYSSDLNYTNGSYYGTIDLLDRINIPAWMHVVSFDDNGIKVVIEPRQVRNREVK